MKPFFFFQTLVKLPALRWVVLVVLGIEVLFRLGLYSPFLNKKSYASKVNRILERALDPKNSVRPNALIMGTSLAHEGISVPQLNETLKDTGLVFQSIAVPGADLIVQSLVLDRALETLPETKLVVHLNDVQMPWIDRKQMSTDTLAMVSEFSPWTATQKIREEGYEMSASDWAYLWIRWVAYRQDLANFILSPLKRIKSISRYNEEKQNSSYYYDNKYEAHAGLYDFQNFSDCVEKTKPGSPIPEGSDDYHRDALYRTCSLTANAELPKVKNEQTDTYKLRLDKLYQPLREQNIPWVHIFPPIPYSHGAKDIEDRIKFFQTEYKSTLSPIQWDLSEAIPTENNDLFYYDIIHMNKKGKEQFTIYLSYSLKETVKKYPQILATSPSSQKSKDPNYKEPNPIKKESQ